jgi:cellulase/cellobiase CelA1
MWHLTRERVLMLTSAALALAAGTMTILYLSRSDEPRSLPPTAPVARTSGPPAPSRVEPSRPAPVKAAYAVRGRWKDGFNAEVTVTNLGSQPLEGWTVQLDLPAAVDVTSTWGAKVEQHAGRLTLRSQAYNTYLEAGGAIRMGFEAKGEAAQPTGCSVNGSPC